MVILRDDHFVRKLHFNDSVLWNIFDIDSRFLDFNSFEFFKQLILLQINFNECFFYKLKFSFLIIIIGVISYSAAAIFVLLTLFYHKIDFEAASEATRAQVGNLKSHGAFDFQLIVDLRWLNRNFLICCISIDRQSNGTEALLGVLGFLRGKIW